MAKLIYEKLEDLPGEVWLSVDGYEGFYEVSNLGKVKRVAWSLRAKPGYILKTHTWPNGYPCIRLRKPKEKRTGHLLHRMVATAFIPNPDCLPEVNHKNGVPLDCRVGNLEWVTHSDNLKHMWRVLKTQSRMRKFILVSPDGEFFETDNLSVFARELGINGASFYRVLSGRYPSYRGWTCSYAD